MIKKFVLFLATGAGVGFLPGPQGTYGTLLAILLYLATKGLPFYSNILFVVSFCFLAIWSANLAERYFQEEDSGKIVIDEIAGYLVTMLALPFDSKTVVAGFIFFRLFDIFKPFPANWCEKHLSGGLGIVCDDLVAGVYANICLRILLALNIWTLIPGI